jgi:hypothetical protein
MFETRLARGDSIEGATIALADWAAPLEPWHWDPEPEVEPETPMSQAARNDESLAALMSMMGGTVARG